MKTTLSIILLVFAMQISKAQTDTLETNLNFAAINQSLLASPHEINVGIGQSSKSETIVYLPYKDGNLKAFKLIEYDIVPAALRKEIKTYYGQMLEDPTIDCRLTLANGEIRVNFNEFEGTYAIEKNVRSSNANAYWFYKVEATLPACGVEEHLHKNGRIAADHAVMFNTHGTQLRTYRLALIVTNDFYTAGGGTNSTVNAYTTSIVNNINGLYEKEIAVRFTLVSPNNPISSNVFFNYGGSTNNLLAIHSEIDTRFSNANYDLGHCLRSSGGGVAYLGVICNISFKGGALSGVSPSNIRVFAHELGHQFNAGHTFNGNGSGNCGPANRMNNDAYEPGSGNTIMSYSDICSPGSYNITGGSVLYFHTHSQESMINFIKSSSGSCGVVSSSGNTAPVVAGLTGFTIPRNTPFTLTGSATDANSDPLTYTWEQYNLATVADTGRLGHTANSLGTSAVNSPTAPLFRTVQSTSPTRNFPNLTYVLNNANNPPDNIGEDLPNVARTLNFRLTARDNRAGGGGVAFQQVAIVISNNGPFEVTTGNGPTLWFQGENKTITWNVNGTTAAPISCANVRILTSLDGGTTFTTLIASTPNDGTHPFTVPNSPTSQFRIKIEAIGNIFYDINNVNITISNGTCMPEVTQIGNNSQLNTNFGSSLLNLNLTILGTLINNFSGTITATDPAANLSFSQNGICSGPSNSNRFDSYKFQVVTSGNYTFSNVISGGLIMNLYEQSYNSNSVCSNWVASSGFRASSSGPVSLNSNLTANLSPGVYELIISTFSNNTPIPANYNISKTGSDIYGIIPSNASPYSFTYIIINVINNQILNFSQNPNLTAYPPGSYRIYGLSFAGGANLNSFINTSFTAFQTALNNSTFCGQLSSNFKNVNISNCMNSLVLVSPMDNISTGNVINQASALSGNIFASNIISGNNTRAIYQAKSIELQPGFIANSGTFFTAAVGGCN